MAETIELTVEPRSQDTGKAGKRLRRQGLLPGILYGYNLTNPKPIQVDVRTFERVYHRAGNMHLVDVHVNGGETTRALIRGVTRDPVSHAPTHVDFMAVNLRQEMIGHVPVVLTGEAPAVRDDIGVLLHALDTLTVKALPDEMPETITADVSGLITVGAAIYVKDLAIPPGLNVLADPDTLVARITAVRVVPEEEAAATEAAEAEASGVAGPPGGEAGGAT